MNCEKCGESMVDQEVDYRVENKSVCFKCFREAPVPKLFRPEIQLKPSPTNELVTRVSHHYVAPPICPGGRLEIVGGREMLRLPDSALLLADNRTYRLTETWQPTWQPGNFDKSLYV